MRLDHSRRIIFDGLCRQRKRGQRRGKLRSSLVRCAHNPSHTDEEKEESREWADAGAKRALHDAKFGVVVHFA